MASSLRSRLAILLVLANIPAAALAIGATLEGREAERRQREDALVQRAELIATRAGLTLGIAEGVADTLAAIPAIATASSDCGELLELALAYRSEYAGIVVADAEGRPLCGAGRTDISADSRSALLRAVRGGQANGDAIFLAEQIAPDEEVVLLARPFTAPDGRRGAIGLGLHRNVFDAIFLPSSPSATESSALALIRSGGVIVSEFGSAHDADWRPAEPLPLGALATGGAGGVQYTTRDGVPYFYAISPIQGTLAGVVVATPVAALAATDWMRFLLAVAAPLLMLLLGILAVFVGMDRLVLRWIARFRQATSSYAQGNYTPRIVGLGNASSEIADLGAGINDMAARVQERSTALEEAIDGKNALLRELHHRVKNNFQMIASLLALQRRELPQRLRMLLRIPEDRVLAMAAAYKASYATGEIGHVSTHDLLRDIAGQLRQSFGIAAPVIQIETSDEPIWLDLDQAVPLGLLVSEILTSALDRAGAASLPVEIRASRAEPGIVHVEMKSAGMADSLPSTGLASRLVAAYRTQIHASMSSPSDDLVVIAMPVQSAVQAHPGRVELGS